MRKVVLAAVVGLGSATLAQAQVRAPGAPQQKSAGRGAAEARFDQHPGVQEHRRFRPLARRLPQGSGWPRAISQRTLSAARSLPDARSEHHLDRPRPALLRPELPRVLRQARLAQSPAERRRAGAAAQGAVRPRRAAVRRAGRGDHRVLGARERFRLRHGQQAGAALAGDARLRLPPVGDVPRRAAGGAEDHRPRRPAARAR